MNDKLMTRSVYKAL